MRLEPDLSASPLKSETCTAAQCPVTKKQEVQSNDSRDKPQLPCVIPAVPRCTDPRLPKTAPQALRGLQVGPGLGWSSCPKPRGIAAALAPTLRLLCPALPQPRGTWAAPGSSRTQAEGLCAFSALSVLSRACVIALPGANSTSDSFCSPLEAVLSFRAPSELMNWLR